MSPQNGNGCGLASLTAACLVLAWSALASAGPLDEPIPSWGTVPSEAQSDSAGFFYVSEQGPVEARRWSPSDRLSFHVMAWSCDGDLSQPSLFRGRSQTVAVGDLPAILVTALATMSVGERRRIWTPSTLGLGGSEQGGVVFDLVFDGEQRAPQAPPDVAAPPPDADWTASGLASKVIVQGSGARHPTAQSKVEVHYSGWTTDGELFDSSLVRGQTAVFPLNAVIAGWQEGVVLMVEGETRRLWIPASLAYEGSKHGPQGMLVFDVELVRIVD